MIYDILNEQLAQGLVEQMRQELREQALALRAAGKDLPDLLTWGRRQVPRGIARHLPEALHVSLLGTSQRATILVRETCRHFADVDVTVHKAAP